MSKFPKLGIDICPNLLYNAYMKHMKIVYRKEIKMSKNRVVEMKEEEIAEYRDWSEEQVALAQEAEDREYLKWFLEGKRTQPKLHGKKDIPSKIGTRKHALATDKWGIDCKSLKQGLEMAKILKLSDFADSLVERAEAEYEKGNEDRALELLDNAMAIEDRIDTKVYGEQSWKKGHAVRRRERQNSARADVQAEGAFAAEVEATWGQERGEFETLADRETFEKRSCAAKKAAQTRKVNQEKRDAEYLAWYNENKGDQGK